MPSMVASRTVPTSASVSPALASSRMAITALSTRSAWRNSRSPTSLSLSPVRWRSNTAMPSEASIWSMRLLTVEWSSRSRFAVWLRFPARAAHRNTRKSSQLSVSNIQASIFALEARADGKASPVPTGTCPILRNRACDNSDACCRHGDDIAGSLRAGFARMLPRFKAAAVHAAPVFLDRQATTEKAVAIIREAARAGAELIAFPETYIPAFPVWAALWTPIDNHDLFVRMAEQSVRVDGPEVARLCAEARALGVTVSIGISERAAVSDGCLWNANL